MHITKDEILMGRDKQFPDDYNDEISNNIDKLLIPLNQFRELYGNSITISSGWRPPSINIKVGGASHSNHCLGLAADLHDPDGKIDAFAQELDKSGKLKELGLWLENPKSTPGWTHLDIKDRGDRASNIFVP